MSVLALLVALALVAGTWSEIENSEQICKMENGKMKCSNVDSDPTKVTSPAGMEHQTEPTDQDQSVRKGSFHFTKKPGDSKKQEGQGEPVPPPPQPGPPSPQPEPQPQPPQGKPKPPQPPQGKPKPPQPPPQPRKLKASDKTASRSGNEKGKKPNKWGVVSCCEKCGMSFTNKEL